MHTWYASMHDMHAHTYAWHVRMHENYARVPFTHAVGQGEARLQLHQCSSSVWFTEGGGYHVESSARFLSLETVTWMEEALSAVKIDDNNIINTEAAQKVLSFQQYKHAIYNWAMHFVWIDTIKGSWHAMMRVAVKFVPLET